MGFSYYIRCLDPIVGDTEMTGEDPVCFDSRTVLLDCEIVYSVLRTE